MTPHVLADDNLARINRSFNARRCIDAISVDIAICVYSDIANMNTNSEIVRATRLGRFLSIFFAKRGCGAHSHFSARKFGEDCVAEEFDDSTFVALHNGARERLQDFNQL